VKTGMQQQTGLRQELRINPRLYQAMDMLYMPMLDLQQHLQQELLNNPFLELEEPEEEEAPEKTTEQENEEVKKDDEIDWEEILLNGFDVGGTREQFESMEFAEPVSVESRNLTAHLRDQLQMLELTPRQHLLCDELLGNINDDGYLGCSPEELLESANQWLLSNAPRPGDDDEEDADAESPPAASAVLPPGVHAFSMEELLAALKLVQSLDPAGVGARDVRECLMLQLVEAGQGGSLAFLLVEQAFPDLIAHRWNDLARKFGVGPKEAQTAADLLSKFDPKPGR